MPDEKRPALKRLGGSAREAAAKRRAMLTKRPLPSMGGGIGKKISNILKHPVLGRLLPALAISFAAKGSNEAKRRAAEKKGGTKI